jgi:hypothetical protein
LKYPPNLTRDERDSRTVPAIGVAVNWSDNKKPRRGQRAVPVGARDTRMLLGVSCFCKVGTCEMALDTGQ